METFRDTLDVFCRSRRIQYAELARRVGVTKSYIGQLVHGHSKPPPPGRVRQLADALGLSPGERRRLVDLALRERARGEARVRIEELEASLATLRSAVTDLVLGLLDAALRQGEPLPEAIAERAAEDELLAELCAAGASGVAEAQAALKARLARVPPEELAAELAFLDAAVGAQGGTLDAGAAPPPVRSVPVIGYVAAGETDVAFTDAGLPAGVGMPGEEPVPRWHGLGQRAYALRISGESMMPLCPPGTTIVVDPDRTPRRGELGICQTTDDKTYFKILQSGTSDTVRLTSTNPAVAADMVLKRSQVRRLQKVVATIFP